MNAPESTVAATVLPLPHFALVPETTLPGGIVVPAFRVSRYVCTQGDDGLPTVSSDGKPWVNISYHEAVEACQRAGFALLTERQWLAMAHNAAAQNCNWTKGKVGEGKLFRGLRKGNVSEAQPGNVIDTASPKERRWLTLSNGEGICDLNGNVFQWVTDDVQGDDKGLTTVIKADSPSLSAPYPSMTKGMGWRPDGEHDWSGYALVRGGYWCSESHAGAFLLRSGWPVLRFGSVGFRCTQPLDSDPRSLVAA
jgi:formylglycine-generating enzyme required for sulfatase activity